MELARRLREFIDELPRDQLPELKGLLERRLCAEQLAALTPPAAPPDEPDLTLKAAGVLLGCSAYEVRAMCQRGELEGYQRVPGGVWHIPAAAVRRYRERKLARGVDVGYTPTHDTPRGKGPPPPARLDAAPSGGRAQRDRDQRRALGTRRARRQPAGRDEPYAPGQAAWALPPPNGKAPPPEG
jgi:hypothetical protein